MCVREISILLFCCWRYCFGLHESSNLFAVPWTSHCLQIWLRLGPMKRWAYSGINCLDPTKVFLVADLS